MAEEAQSQEPHTPQKSELIRDPRRDEKGRFGAGNCANPGGRPKGARSLTSVLREILEEDVPGVVRADGKPMGGIEFLARSIVQNATKGNGSILKEAWDRLEGKVPERIQTDWGPDFEFVFEEPPTEEQPAEQEGVA